MGPFPKICMNRYDGSVSTSIDSVTVTASIRSMAKACTRARMKPIGVKIMVVTSATFDVGRLGLKKKKQKHEETNGLVVFCQEI